MEFLPIAIHGQRVYAGAWDRLCAGVVDTLIILPVAFLIIWLEGLDRNLAIVIAVPSSVMFAVYSVVFHARLGGTPGKLVVGIRVCRPNGTPIGWAEAWKRSSVDIVFAGVTLVVSVWALAHVDPMEYSSLQWVDRARLLHSHGPPWFSSVGMLQTAWMYSEVVVVLFTRRKRALHDLIAGTVVVRKQFAQPTPSSFGPPAAGSPSGEV